MPRVGQIMNKSPKSIGPTTSVVSAAKTMRSERVGSLLVKQGKQFVGIVTDTDIVTAGSVAREASRQIDSREDHDAPICTIERSQSVDDAQDMMGDLGIRHLGVTSGGEIVGVVSVRDLLLHYKRYAQSKITPEAMYPEPKIAQD